MRNDGSATVMMSSRMDTSTQQPNLTAAFAQITDLRNLVSQLVGDLNAVKVQIRNWIELE